MNLNKKYLPFIIGAVVVVVGLASVLVLSGKKEAPQQETSMQETESEVVPTVDSSVQVTLEEGDERGYVVLMVEGIPDGTESIEYEFSYNTVEQGLQGILPDEPIDVSGKSEYSKEFFLGTQSSGAKTYHKVDGPIHVALRFNGSYGSKSFEKEFEM